MSIGADVSNDPAASIFWMEVFQNHLEVVDGGVKITRNVSNCEANDIKKRKVFPLQARCGPEVG